MKMRCIYPFTNNRREGVKNKQFIKILEFIFGVIMQEILTSRKLYKQWDFGYNVIKEKVWCIHFYQTNFTFTAELKI